MAQEIFRVQFFMGKAAIRPSLAIYLPEICSGGRWLADPGDDYDDCKSGACSRDEQKSWDVMRTVQRVRNEFEHWKFCDVGGDTRG